MRAWEGLHPKSTLPLPSTSVSQSQPKQYHHSLFCPTNIHINHFRSCFRSTKSSRQCFWTSNQGGQFGKRKCGPFLEQSALTKVIFLVSLRRTCSVPFICKARKASPRTKRPLEVSSDGLDRPRSPEPVQVGDTTDAWLVDTTYVSKAESSKSCESDGRARSVVCTSKASQVG